MPRIETNDYYAIIDVANTATPDEIKKSYRRRARDLHPDKNHSNPNATADFQRVSFWSHALISPL
jgi:molecular chaperone DnaJ